MREFKKGPRKGAYNAKAPKRDKSGPLEMHQASCVQCKKFCEVPFKPNGKKPVFCRDCFGMQEKGAPSATRPERTFVHRSTAPRQEDVQSQLAALNTKIDMLTRMVGALGSSKDN